MTADFVEDAMDVLKRAGQPFLVIQVGPPVSPVHNDGREAMHRFAERGRQDVRALLAALEFAKRDLEKLL